VTILRIHSRKVGINPPIRPAIEMTADSPIYLFLLVDVTPTRDQLPLVGREDGSMFRCRGPRYLYRGRDVCFEGEETVCWTRGLRDGHRQGKSRGRSGFGSVLQSETKTVLLLRIIGPQEERRG
jgi:hypothetical protein